MGLIFARRPEPEVRSWWSSDFTGTSYQADGPSGLRLIPMYAATRLIAEQIAAAPLHAYQPKGSTRTLLPTQPALLRNPSAACDLFAWKYRLMTSLLLWGNAYGLIVARDSNGWPTQIEWLPPARVGCVGDGTRPPEFTLDSHRLDNLDVLHITAYTIPGRAKGISPIGNFRLAIETGQSAQQYARDWYDGGGIPAAVVRNETQTITAESANLIKARLKSSLSNGDPFVTGKDWTYTPVGAPAADARFIETSRLTATQIAAIYGVPPEEIGGETGTSLTYSTVEMNQLKLAIQVYRPWAVRIENALSELFLGRTYLKFNLDSGVRADLKTRYESYQIALQLGLLTLPEARALEERAPLTQSEIDQWQSLYPAKGTTNDKPAN